MSYSDKPATIYAIWCTETNRVYIGSTVNVVNRINKHFSDLRKCRKAAHLFDRGTSSEWSVWQQDFNKYGEDAFETYIVEENVPKENRAERETYWTKYYNATDPRYGYNIRYDIKTEYEIKYGLPPIPKKDGE